MAPALAASDRLAPKSASAVSRDAEGQADTSSPGGVPSDTGAESREPPAQLLSGTAGRVQEALTELRNYLSSKADYVGRGFADEARRIHLGESDDRAIWGEASPDEAKELADEGISVAPLPFLTRRDD